jgi:hypothetical protein
MGKWIVRLILLAVIGGVGYYAYLFHRGGYFDLPEIGENSYTMTFKNGVRGIFVDPEVTNPMPSNSRYFRRLISANPERQYLALAIDVPRWFEDTWSYCHPPTDEERAAVERDLTDETKRDLIGARFEAICKIDADGESIWRGLIYSVPKQ